IRHGEVVQLLSSTTFPEAQSDEKKALQEWSDMYSKYAIRGADINYDAIDAWEVDPAHAKTMALVNRYFNGGPKATSYNNVPGLIIAGNIDLTNRPTVKNAD